MIYELLLKYEWDWNLPYSAMALQYVHIFARKGNAALFNILWQSGWLTVLKVPASELLVMEKVDNKRPIITKLKLKRVYWNSWVRVEGWIHTSLRLFIDCYSFLGFWMNSTLSFCESLPIKSFSVCEKMLSKVSRLPIINIIFVE